MVLAQSTSPKEPHITTVSEDQLSQPPCQDIAWLMSAVCHYCFFLSSTAEINCKYDGPAGGLQVPHDWNSGTAP
jgi:hypothetical protein